MRYTRWMPGGIAVAAALALGLTLTGPGATATPTRASTAPKVGHTTTTAVVTWQDPKTHQVRRQVYGEGSAGRTLQMPRTPLAGHGSGPVNTPCNPCGVTLTQHSYSTLGKEIWHFRIHVEYYHDLQGPGLDHVISVSDTGTAGIADSSFWTYDGLLDKDNYYYAYCCGVAHSGYYFMRKGQFEGQFVGGYTRYERPRLWIKVHGTSWEWDTQCC